MGDQPGMDGRVSGQEYALRQRLHRLLEQARANEEKLRALNSLELKLIATRSPTELIERIVAEIPVTFGLGSVTVALVDRQGELPFLLGDSHGTVATPPELIFLADDRLLRAAMPRLTRPYLGPFSRVPHSPLFPASLGNPGSIALLPLRRGQELWGSLNFASGDSSRFDRASRTDFLERLAAVVSICLENAVNYERLRQMGMKDALTGVNNRRYLHERLEQELAACFRRDQPLTCMFLDIDHFKGFNDRFGHEAGDTVLSEVAGLIRSQIRRSDALCRYGGEEFVLLMPDTAEHAGRETAERIRRTIAGHHFIVPGDSRVQVTLSIGVAVSPCKGVHPDDSKALLRSADRALYRAKEAGRNLVMSADEESGDPSGARRRIE